MYKYFKITKCLFMTLRTTCSTKLPLGCCSSYSRCLKLIFTFLVCSCSFNVVYCYFLSQIVTSHDDELMKSAMFSVADVVVEGGNPTRCAVDDSFVTLFRKGRIRICLPD